VKKVRLKKAWSALTFVRTNACLFE
jgi:hypothetical protein